MKIAIVSSHANGPNMGVVQAQLLDFLPNVVSDVNQADVVVTVAGFMHDYVFNRTLLDVKKPVVVLDYLEFGWDYPDNLENRMGYGCLQQCGHLNNPEYAALDGWVKDQPPFLTFKRELRLRDKSSTMLPAEFLCTQEGKARHTKEKFDTRPFSILNIFGLSHPMRFQLHGEVFTDAHRHGYNVVDKWSMEQHLEKNNFVSIYSPWQTRKDLSEVLRWQRRAKISVSLPGAGWKCFRHGESCIDSIMALPYDNLAWAYDWLQGMNCIRLRPDHLLEDLIEASQRENLYDIYLASRATAELYRSANYAKDYVVQAITDRL